MKIEESLLRMEMRFGDQRHRAIEIFINGVPPLGGGGGKMADQRRDAMPRVYFTEQLISEKICPVGAKGR